MYRGRVSTRCRCRRTILATALALVVGCELAEVAVTEPLDIVVAEVHLSVVDGLPRGLAVLHRTTGHASTGVPGALITVRRRGGEAVEFQEVSRSECFDPQPPDGLVVSCYLLAPAVATGIVEASATLDAELLLPGGGRLQGSVTLPGDLELLGPPGSGPCALPPGTSLPMEWTPAPGTWAYLPEAEIEGLRKALGPIGIEVPVDPLTLQGLAISEADTSIRFPTGFGVFDRFSGDADLLLAIRDGLPSGTAADIRVSAAERNAVNWLRGGNFNPSGQIRIPSLFGEGVGVFAATVSRSTRVVVGEAAAGLPSCLDPG